MIKPLSLFPAKSNLLAERAFRDATDLFRRDKKAHVGFWAYQNGNSVIFNALCHATRTYTYFHRVQKIISERKKCLASDVADTETAILVGAAEAVRYKELPVLLEILQKENCKLKRIILIDVSRAFNERAANIVKQEVHKLNPRVSVATIDKDIFDLSPADMQTLQRGIVTLFMHGGLPFNSPGDVSQGLPRGKIMEMFEAISRIISFGEHPERNAFITDHKELIGMPSDAEAEYPSVLDATNLNAAVVQNEMVEGVPVDQANYETFFLHAFAHMLDAIPNFHIHNPNICENGKISILKLKQYFRHYCQFDPNSSNLVNGLEVDKDCEIIIPSIDTDRLHRYTLRVINQERFVLFNTIYPSQSVLSDYMGDIKHPMKICRTYEGPLNGIKNILSIARPTPPTA